MMPDGGYSRPSAKAGGRFVFGPPLLAAIRPRSILRSNATGAQSHDPKHNCSGRRALAAASGVRLKTSSRAIRCSAPRWRRRFSIIPILPARCPIRSVSGSEKAPPTASVWRASPARHLRARPIWSRRQPAICRALPFTTPRPSGFLPPLLNFKGYVALQAWRVSNRLWREGRTDLALLLQSLSSDQLQVSMHPSASIGTSVFLDHATGIIIGAFAVIGDGVTILQNVTIGRNPSIRTVLRGLAEESAQHGGDDRRRRLHRRLRQDRRGGGGRARRARRMHRGRRARAADQLPRAGSFRLTATPRTTRNGLRPQSYPSCQLPLARTESVC